MDVVPTLVLIEILRYPDVSLSVKTLTCKRWYYLYCRNLELFHQPNEKLVIIYPHSQNYIQSISISSDSQIYLMKFPKLKKVELFDFDLSNQNHLNFIIRHRRIKEASFSFKLQKLSHDTTLFTSCICSSILKLEFLSVLSITWEFDQKAYSDFISYLHILPLTDLKLKIGSELSDVLGPISASLLKLKKLSLVFGVEVNSLTLSSIVEFSQLVELHVGSTDLISSISEFQLHPSYFPKLEKIDFYNNVERDSTFHYLSLNEKWPNFKELHLTKADMEDSINLANFENVEFLNVSITSFSLLELLETSISKLPFLVNLRLDYEAFISTASSYGLLLPLVNLKELCVSGQPPGYLFKGPFEFHLRKLELLAYEFGTNIDTIYGEIILSFIASQSDSLEFLICNCFFSLHELADISACFPRLKIVELKSESYTQEAHIKWISKLPCLIKYGFSGNNEALDFNDNPLLDEFLSEMTLLFPMVNFHNSSETFRQPSGCLPYELNSYEDYSDGYSDLYNSESSDNYSSYFDFNYSRLSDFS